MCVHALLSAFNLIKKEMKKIIATIACSSILLASCTSESDLMNQDDSSLQAMSLEIDKITSMDQLSEFGKNETILPENEIKVEGYDDGKEKVETSAPNELKLKIKEIVEQSFYKERAYRSINDGEGLVGVLESVNGGCGSYKKLLIFMDTEDRKGHSWTSGNVGASFVDGNKNVQLKICVVPTANVTFKRGVSEYALLHLGGVIPTGVSTITRFFDNEDSSNANAGRSFYNGKAYSGPLGQCIIGEGNTTLAFLYYESDYYTPDAFPSLGVSYGVFGKVGDSRAQIYTDDEDSNNTNWCYITKNNIRYDRSGNIGDVLITDNNTMLNISMIR